MVREIDLFRLAVVAPERPTEADCGSGVDTSLANYDVTQQLRHTANLSQTCEDLAR